MHKRKGYTLIELLVVVAVIALLMAILMPTLQQIRRKTIMNSEARILRRMADSVLAV